MHFHAIILSSFLASLNSGTPVSKSKYEVTFDVGWSPECIDGRCYDIKTMSKYLDQIFVMSYDERSQIKTGPCIAGANSGFYQTLRGLSKYLELGISPGKLILGVPWYGRDYPCTHLDPKKDWCHIEEVPFRGVNCSDSPGVENNYATLHAMMKHMKLTPQWDEKTESVYFNYEDKSDNSSMHQVWFDNPRSLNEKYDLVKKLSLGGAGMWHAVALDNSDSAEGRRMRAEFWNQLAFD